jgi:hypothetical protein
MSFDYQLDNERRQLLITYHGEFLVSEAVALFDRMVANGAWSYAVLNDLRDMTGRPTIEDLQELVRARDTIGADLPRRGPVAFLVTDPALYGRVCAYAALARGSNGIEVFRARDEAYEWLAKQGAAP